MYHMYLNDNTLWVHPKRLNAALKQGYRGAENQLLTLQGPYDRTPGCLSPVRFGWQLLGWSPLEKAVTRMTLHDPRKDFEVTEDDFRPDPVLWTVRTSIWMRSGKRLEYLSLKTNQPLPILPHHDLPICEVRIERWLEDGRVKTKRRNSIFETSYEHDELNTYLPTETYF